MPAGFGHRGTGLSVRGKQTQKSYGGEFTVRLRDRMGSREGSQPERVLVQGVNQGETPWVNRPQVTKLYPLRSELM